MKGGEITNEDMELINNHFRENNVFKLSQNPLNGYAKFVNKSNDNNLKKLRDIKLVFTNDYSGLGEIVLNSQNEDNIFINLKQVDKMYILFRLIYILLNFKDDIELNNLEDLMKSLNETVSYDEVTT